MHRKILLYSLIAAGVALMGACENYKDCNSPVETSLGISFNQMVDSVRQDSTLPALTMYGIGREDSLLADEVRDSVIYVPLDQNTDITRFYIRPDTTMNNGDTLTLAYKRTLNFVSSGCGFATLFNLDTAYCTYHYIDSIALVNSKIITSNAINIQIYF